MMNVSLIIPVYNVESYILLCLHSVASQTFQDGVECILVDDCGSDNSVELARKFCDEYKGNIQFKIVKREKNGGLSAARNTGIENATGQYLYFLDSDDEITPNCLSIMYSKIEKYGDVDLVQGSFYETEQEYRTLSNYNLPEHTSDRKVIKNFLLTYAGDVVGAQSRLIRRDFLIKHNLFFKDGIIHEDNYWTFFLAKYVTSMCFCPERTYYHRYNPTSITGNVNIEKETIAYKTIIEVFCSNIDPLLAGRQKELILETLLTVLNGHFYRTKEEKKFLIMLFVKQNNGIERRLLYVFLYIKDGFLKTKILHLLIRLYKLND